MKQIDLCEARQIFEFHRESYSVGISLVLCCLAMGVDTAGQQCKLHSYRAHKGKKRDWISIVATHSVHPYFKWLYDLHKQYDIPCCRPDQLRDLAAKLANAPSISKNGRICSMVDNFIGSLFSYQHFIDGDRLAIKKEISKDGILCYTVWWKSPSDKDAHQWNAWMFYDLITNNPDSPVRYCPYCNADTIYALTYKCKKNEVDLLYARSALDHFYYEKGYPILGLTLSNLVPACTRCNSRFKGSMDIGKPSVDLIYPYAEDMDKCVKFTWGHQIEKALTCALDPLDLEICYNCSSSTVGSRAEQTLDVFKIKDLYEQVYAQEVCNLPVLLDIAYSLFEEDTIRILGCTDEGMCNPSMLRRKSLIVGCPISHNGINAHRLAKIKLDLIEELESSSVMKLCV